MEHEYDITKKVTSGECFIEAYSDFKKNNNTAHIRYVIMAEDTFEDIVKENDMHLSYMSEKNGYVPPNAIRAYTLGKKKVVDNIPVLIDISLGFGKIKFIK